MYEYFKKSLFMHMKIVGQRSLTRKENSLLYRSTKARSDEGRDIAGETDKAVNIRMI